MKQNKNMIFFFTVPATVLFVTIFIYPIFRTALMSFFSIQEITDAFSKWEFVGLSNYVELTKNSLFVQSWVNLFKIFVLGGILTLGTSLILAVIIESGVKGKSFFRAAIYLPNVISSVAMATMWIQYVFNSNYGLLTKLFGALGLDSLANIQWLSSEYKFTALLVSYCFGMIGHFMLIWISGITRIPDELYEAASIDGASKLNQFINITLPLLKGIFRTNIIMWSISVSGFFIWSKLFSPLVADTQTVVPMIYMYQKLFGAENVDKVSRNAGSGAAVGVLLTLFVVAIFVIVNRTLKDDDLEF